MWGGGAGSTEDVTRASVDNSEGMFRSSNAFARRALHGSDAGHVRGFGCLVWQHGVGGLTPHSGATSDQQAPCCCSQLAIWAAWVALARSGSQSNVHLS